MGKLAETVPLVGLVALSVATCLVPSETPPAAGWEIPLVMAWMLLLAAWAVIGLLRRTLVLRYDLASAAIVLFFGWLCISSAVNLSDSDQRATLNMTFRWFGFGIMFFLARQSLVTPRAQRAAVAVMISLAVGIAALGIYEYAVIKPAQRAAYEADPAGEREKAGVFAPEGSPAERQFRDRVASVEPLATFALTNSLAGLLTPWLLVALGVAWQAGRSQLVQFRACASPSPGELGMLAILAFGTALIALCLLLTKSRSAWGATAVGLALLMALAASSRGLKADWRWALGGGAVVAGLVAVAAAIGGLDLEVASEAVKSLAFRMQYWQATAAMIAERPWFGIGVGNFQQHYAGYRLANASEMISDPHNFVLEVAATVGLPALIPLLAALAATGFCAWRSRKQPTATGSDASDSSTATATDKRSLLPVYLGVALGFLVALPLQLMSSGPNAAVLLVVAPATGCCLIALRGWIGYGRLPLGAVAAALAALLVNLLAAGGIGFASVSLHVWLLAAVILGAAPAVGRFRGARQLSRGQSIGVVVAVSLLVAVFYLLAYRPVLNSRMPLQTGEMLVRQGQYQSAMPLLRQAAAADPWNADPYRLLAVATQRQWLENRGDALFSEFEQMADEAIRRNPNAHTLRTEIGHRYLESYRATGDEELLARAIEHQQAAVRLNPNDAFARAQLTWLLSVAGREEEAFYEAWRAIELDRINTHNERDLTVRKLFDTEGNLPGEGTAIEVLEQVTNVEQSTTKR